MMIAWSPRSPHKDALTSHIWSCDLCVALKARKMVQRLLIVEDDLEICNLLRHAVTRAGYEAVVVTDGQALLQSMENGPYDLVLLDLGLPDMDGLSLIDKVRDKEPVPIIIITGKNNAQDRISGLDRGADDYIGKPFLPEELLARIRSVLRRAALPVASLPTAHPAGEASQAYRFHGITVDLTRRQITEISGKDLHLTSTEFDLLVMLLQHKNQPVGRELLLERVFDRDWSPFDRSIDVHMANLRRKIEPDPKVPHIIKTVRGRGYMLVGPVELIGPEAADRLPENSVA